MKHSLFVIVLSLLCLMPSGMLLAQDSAAKEDTALVDDGSGVVAYSDTTSVATAADSLSAAAASANDFDENDDEDLSFVTGNLYKMMKEEGAEMLFVIIVLLIIFVLSPLVIIGVVLYFIHKNRRDRMRVMEKAIDSGQKIPGELLPATMQTAGELWNKGVRQACIGVGLMFFLGYTAGEVGFGIGCLVTAIGVGNLIIARKERKDDNLNSNL